MSKPDDTNPPETTAKPDDAPPAPAPDPTPDPPPPPKPETEPVTRQEFNGLTEAMTQLTTTVSSLVEKLGDTNPIHDSKPVSVPWTHRGSRKVSE